MEPSMKNHSLRMTFGMLVVLSCFLSSGLAQTNLIPNPCFADPKNPLLGWRTSFPYEGWYADNVKYVKPANMQGKQCALIELPPGVAGNQGGKIESAFVKAEPGATYRVEVDCLTWDFGAKVHAEAWTHDPKPIDKPDKFRVPSAEGHPALVMCYRAQVPSPTGGSKKWTTAAREFTVPETVTVAGEAQKPEYLSIKVVAYAATPNAGKSYFTNFRLTKIK
jgi:hypothetical protein